MRYVLSEKYKTIMAAPFARVQNLSHLVTQVAPFESVFLLIS